MSDAHEEIYIARHVGHGIVVRHAPARARLSLAALTARGFITLTGPSTINIADQVTYRVTGYDTHLQALTLELAEDWRPVPTARLTEAEYEQIKARWQEQHGRPGAAHPLVILDPHQGDGEVARAHPSATPLHE